jgi:hypothetical protein
MKADECTDCAGSCGSCFHIGRCFSFLFFSDFGWAQIYSSNPEWGAVSPLQGKLDPNKISAAGKNFGLFERVLPGPNEGFLCKPSTLLS